jgi:hypothetical protein
MEERGRAGSPASSFVPAPVDGRSPHRMTELQERIERGEYDMRIEDVALAIWLATNQALRAFSPSRS